MTSSWFGTAFGRLGCLLDFTKPYVHHRGKTHQTEMACLLWPQAWHSSVQPQRLLPFLLLSNAHSHQAIHRLQLAALKACRLTQQHGCSSVSTEASGVCPSLMAAAFPFNTPSLMSRCNAWWPEEHAMVSSQANANCSGHCSSVTYH